MCVYVPLCFYVCSMYVCVFVYFCVYVFVLIFLRTFVVFYICIYVSICASIFYVCSYVHLCFVCICIWLYVIVFIIVYVVYVCVRVCVFVRQNSINRSNKTPLQVDLRCFHQMMSSYLLLLSDHFDLDAYNIVMSYPLHIIWTWQQASMLSVSHETLYVHEFDIESGMLLFIISDYIINLHCDSVISDSPGTWQLD